MDCLRQIKWIPTTSRKNVSPTPKCNSMVFGLTRRPFYGYVEAKANDDYPEVFSYLQELIQKEHPEFEYTSITLNYNLQCQPHNDKNNKGPSMIIGLGFYEGGELVIEGINYDIKNKVLIFNGAEKEHWTNPFTGDRYSVVYYSVK